MAGRRSGVGAITTMMAAALGCGDSTGSTSGASATTAGASSTGDTSATGDGTTSAPTSGATTTAGSDSATGTTAATTGPTSGTSVTDGGTTVDSTGAVDSTGGTTDGTSTTDGGTTGVPVEPGCSADLHDVIDQFDNVLETCPPDQGCSAGACVPACDAAAASKANFGCVFIAPTPPAYPPALPPCFAAFVANTWGSPAKLSLERGGVPLDISVAARLVVPNLAPKDWPALPPEGVPADSVAVVFLSSDPKAIMPETLAPLTCPAVPAVNGSTVIKGSGRGAAFILKADIPVTAYDMLPFGGAPSYFPSAELLFPTAVWGTNYVAMAPPAGTASPPGPLYVQIVGLEDGTKVELRPTADLLQGTGLNGAMAGQLAAFDVARGEVLQWELPQGPKDPAGSVLLSDKPVALFAGNRFLRLQPVPAPGGESTHQQNLAISALGSSYVAAPYETRRKDLAPEDVRYRMVGVVDGTTLVYDPPVPAGPPTLKQGQVVDFATPLAFRVQSQDTDHPFALAQLMDTANIPGGSRPGATAKGFPPNLGDEEHVVVLPPAQFLTRYAFFTDPSYGTTNLVLTRVKQDGAFLPVTVDCLGEIQGWKPVGQGGLYEYTTVDLVRAGVGVNGCTNGHHLAESKGAFGVVVWGLDSYASYAYPAGGAADKLSDVMIIPQ